MDASRHRFISVLGDPLFPAPLAADLRGACGGTHVANTGEIGRLVVARIRSEGRRNKRVALAFGQ